MIDKMIVYLWFFMSIMLIIARIRDVGNLQPGMLIVVKVEEARNG